MVFCLTLGILSFVCGTQAKDKEEALVIKRMFAYSGNIESANLGKMESCSYLKYSIKTNRRNVILLGVPSMYAVAHSGEREHVGETYAKITLSGRDKISVNRLLERTTTPHRRKTMPVMLQYLTPKIYSELLINKHILSPFNRKNRKYYHYKAHMRDGDTATVTFRPKLNNTQLVRGQARVEATSGRLISIDISGEYDMVRFKMHIRVGERGLRSYYPSACDLTARFRFLGNDITSEYHSVFGMPSVLADSITDMGDTILLNRVRPLPLTAHEDSLFAKLYARKDSLRDTTKAETRKNKVARRLWNNVDEHIFGHIKSNFGNKDQGYFRINPLLNPLYFGYSKNKGFVYKFDFRGSYYFTPNSLVTLRFKSGYSFKQKRMYFQLPIVYYFNQRKDGYVEMEVRNGNRISNSTVADKIKNERTDSIDWDNMNLKYFNDFSFKFAVNYDISPRIGFQVGLMAHRRSALDKSGFKLAGLPDVYTSVSPTLEIKYRPKGYGGSVFTLDYERSIMGMLGANLEYERFEADWQRILPLTAMSSLQMRAGTGFYTHKGDDWIFLDYTNFHDENIPGGWNDDWACSFELLDKHWYNASEYYLRANVTYESPLLFLSWLPMAGRFMEKERIYVNALLVRHLHPYMEYGYGFKTRLFSLGMFVAQKNWQFDGIGIKFGFELFRDW